MQASKSRLALGKGFIRCRLALGKGFISAHSREYTFIW